MSKQKQNLSRTIEFDDMDSINTLASYAMINYNLTLKKYVEKILKEKIATIKKKNLIPA